jgi:prophage tail gpP-like protein
VKDEVILHIDGRTFRGFKTVAISRGMETGPWQFEFTAAPELDAEGFFSVEDGMYCEIYIDDEITLTGFIDEVPNNYDAKDYTITVAGRSLLGDLVDCSDVGKQYQPGTTLARIAAAECAPYSIKVVVDGSARSQAHAAFASPQARDAGQSPWDFLENLARIRAVLLVSNPDGGLTITRTAARRADGDLELGRNIKGGQGQRSSRSLFSQYHVIGQSPDTFSTNPETPSQQAAILKTTDCLRYRPCLIQTDTPVEGAACRARADWQRRLNLGRSQSVVYTVQGWRQVTDGRLWMPNELVTVTDPRNRLNRTDRLITEARLMLNDQGRTTQLTVMPKEAFALQPLPEPSADGGGA